MAFEWQPAIVPTGMQFNPLDTSFTNLMYNFLIPLEANSLSVREKLTPVKSVTGQYDLTIGVGFDLRTGGVAVQNAVFEAMGFAASVVENGANPNDSDYANEEIEEGYLDRLRADISKGTQAAVDDMTGPMKGNSLAESIAWSARQGLVAYMSPRNCMWNPKGVRLPQSANGNFAP